MRVIPSFRLDTAFRSGRAGSHFRTIMLLVSALCVVAPVDASEPGGPETKLERLRAEYRELVVQKRAVLPVPTPELMLQRQEGHDKLIEESIRKLRLSAEQARRYRLIRWLQTVEPLRKIPPSPLSPSPGHPQPYEASKLWHKNHNAWSRQYFKLQRDAGRHFGERTIGILTPEQRSRYRNSLLEGRQKMPERLSDAKARKQASESDNQRAQWVNLAEHIEESMRIADELIRLTRTGPTGAVELGQDIDTSDDADDPAAWFRARSIVATGEIEDARLKARLETELHHLQKRFDLIEESMELGMIGQAKNNIELLKDVLPDIGALVKEIRAEGGTCNVVLMGLPTDTTVDPIRDELEELEAARAENLEHYHYVQAQRMQIPEHLQQARTNYLNEVWQALVKSLVEWHSPPDWYQVPTALAGWHKESQEQADKILTQQEVIRKLERLQTHLDEEMQSILDRHREEIVEKIEANESYLEALLPIETELRDALSTAGWARWTPD